MEPAFNLDVAAFQNSACRLHHNFLRPFAGSDASQRFVPTRRDYSGAVINGALLGLVAAWPGGFVLLGAREALLVGRCPALFLLALTSSFLSLPVNRCHRTNILQIFNRLNYMVIIFLYHFITPVLQTD